MKYWMEFQANGGQQLANGDASHIVNENSADQPGWEGCFNSGPK